MQKAHLITISGLTLLLLLGVSWVMAGERFTDNGDGTVTDRQLKVMWTKHSNQGNIDWKGAERFCRSGPHALGKHTNWRMPTVAELESLYLGDKEAKGYETDCGQIVKVFPDIRLSCGWVWSSEVRSITAVVYNFHRGYAYTDRMVQMKNYRALPVRDLLPGE